MQSSPFYTFQGSIIKIITSITGEIDFQDTLNFSYNADKATAHNLYDHRMAYFVWIIFLVVIPILLSNMLVSNITRYNHYRAIKLISM